MPPLVEERGRKATTTASHDEIDFTLQNSVEQLLTDDICEEYSMNQSALGELRSIPGNMTCIDCDKPDPEWASVNLGIFMCLDCSGHHRALGTHISFVRSVKLDSWSDPQLQTMFLGGNQQCKDFLIKSKKKSNSCSEDDDFDTLSISQKYDCAATILYQQVLKARRNGEPEPTELPEYTPSRSRSSSPTTVNSRSNAIMEGFGNTTTCPTTTTTPNKKKNIDDVLESALHISQNSIGNAVSLWKNIAKRTKQEQTKLKQLLEKI